jgi:hypothetical protein
LKDKNPAHRKFISGMKLINGFSIGLAGLFFFASCVCGYAPLDKVKAMSAYH